MSQYVFERFSQPYTPAKPSKPEENPLLANIRARLERKQDARIIIAGEGGVGKSVFGLRLGEELNPDIYVKDINLAVYTAISFTGKQYLQSVRQLPSLSMPDFDEPAQGMFHRQFMTEVNMILSKTFIGMRYKRFVSPLSVPNIDLLDIDAVKMAHFFVWIESQGNAQVYRVLPARFGGDPYFKSIVDHMSFGKPGKKLWDLYETRKFSEQDTLHEEFDSRLQELSAPRLTMKEMVSQIAENPRKFFKEDGDEVHYSKIQEEFGVGVNRSYTVKAIAMSEIAKRKKQEMVKSEPSDSHSPPS